MKELLLANLPGRLLYATVAVAALIYVHELGHRVVIGLVLRRRAELVPAGLSIGVRWDVAGVGRAGALAAAGGPAASAAAGYLLWGFSPVPYAPALALFSFLLAIYCLIPFRGLTDGSHIIMFLRGEIGGET